VLAIGAGICALALVAGGVALSGGGDVADSPVRLSALRAVSVVGADGTIRDVGDGDTLRRGDRVRTGRDGSAVLTVERRRVVLAGDTEVVVPDGASLDVRRGSVLLDRRVGPGLSVVAGDVHLERDDAPGALRIDRGFVVQVSVYTGRARVSTSTGRRLRLDALHGVGVAGRTLPSAGRPLALSTPVHPWERDLLADVVSADAAINRLASGRIDATLGTAARARAYVSSFADVLDDVSSTAPASEAVLPVAIGRAGRGGAERTRVAAVRDLRAEGGSWGVVASITKARSGDVASRLETLLVGAEVSADGGGSATPDGGSTTGPVGPAAPSSGPSGPGEGGGSGGTPTRGPAPSRSPSGPSPSASPSASSDPIDELVEDVEELVPTPSLPVPQLSGIGLPIDLQLG
jgi:hypothetical protein